MNSKEKGKRGEREVAKLGQQYGFPTKRSQQYNGLGNADVIGFPLIHSEVKRNEKLNIFNAYEQAVRDNKGQNIPTVFHRKTRETWKVTLSLTYFLEMFACYFDKQVELFKSFNVNRIEGTDTWLVTLDESNFFPIYIDWLTSKGVGLDGSKLS